MNAILYRGAAKVAEKSWKRNSASTDVAVAGKADVLASGDEDVLALAPYDGLVMVPPNTFLRMLDLAQ